MKQRLKKALALLMCLSMVVGLFPAAALAESGEENTGVIAPMEGPAAGEGNIRPAEETEPTALPEDLSDGEVVGSGTCGANLTWSITDQGVLIIRGEGPMEDYTYDDGNEIPISSLAVEPADRAAERPQSSDEGIAPWADYEVSCLRVEEGVTALGAYALFEQRALTEVSLPEGLERIGECCFESCTALAQVSLPDTLTTLEESCFNSCEALTTLALPEGLEELPYECFAFSGLRSLEIPGSVRLVGELALAYCESLSELRFLGSAPSFANDALAGLNVTAYYPGGDSSWDGVAGRDYCGTVTWVSYAAPTPTPEPTATPEPEPVLASGFCGDSEHEGQNLSWKLTVDGTLTISGAGAMYTGAPINIPWMDYRASIRRAVLEEGVTTLASYAFAVCGSLTEVSLPESLEEIGMGVFVNCGLTQVQIPAGVSFIGLDPFTGCLDLTQIQVDPASANYASVDGLLYDKAITELLACPQGKSGSVTVPATVTQIQSGALSNCRALTEIRVEAGSASFAAADGALYDIDLATLIACPAGRSGSIAVPETVTALGAYAFKGCAELDAVSLPEGLVQIGRDAFKGCVGLTELALPDGLTELGSSVFSGCTALTELRIPDGVQTLDIGLFHDCSSLVRLDLGAGVQSVRVLCFEGCSALGEIRFTGSAPNFDEDVFAGVTATVYYPADDASWTEDVRQNYGGTLTWQSYDPGQPFLVASGTCGGSSAGPWTIRAC